MSNFQKERVYILAAAGLLLCATTYGWIQHQHNIETAQLASASTKVVPAAVKLENLESVGAGGAKSAAGTASDANQLAASVDKQGPTYGVPVTSRADAILSAHNSGNRPDPMAPLYVQPGQHYPKYYSNVPSPQNIGWVVPPPPYPVAMEQRDYVLPQPPEPRREVPLHQAVRLTGIIDGRAIFSVPRSIAREQHLPMAFTLGQGESYRNLKLESVESESVTVREGSRICTKTLSSIH